MMTSFKDQNPDFKIKRSKFETFLPCKSAEEYFYFKNFQILKTGNVRQILGKGAFAEVVSVKSKKDGQTYAMKIIEKKKVSNLTMIYEEIAIHCKLKHENIIKLHGYSETNDFFYLVMENAEKGNLYSLIKQNSGIEEERCREIFIMVINAISYLHGLGYAHRDIKPENLLIDKDDIIKVCDFGGSVKIEDGQARNTFFGTYEYMAPEVIEGRKYDRSVDIWALGILLYEMIHGFSPFRILDKKENMKEYYQIYENIVLTEELTIKDSLSDEVAHLIKNLLIKDKSKRISVHKITNHPWINNQIIRNDDIDKSYFQTEKSFIGSIDKKKERIKKNSISSKISEENIKNSINSHLSEMKNENINNFNLEDNDMTDNNDSILEKVVDTVFKNSNRKDSLKGNNSFASPFKVKKGRKESIGKEKLEEIKNNINLLGSILEEGDYLERNNRSPIKKDKENKLNDNRKESIMNDAETRNETKEKKSTETQEYFKGIGSKNQKENTVTLDQYFKKGSTSISRFNKNISSSARKNQKKNTYNMTIEDIESEVNKNDFLYNNDISIIENNKGFKKFSFNNGDLNNSKYNINQNSTLIYSNFDYDGFGLDILENLKIEKGKEIKKEKGFFHFLNKINPFICNCNNEEEQIR